MEHMRYSILYIYPLIYQNNQLNVGRYIIHGSYGTTEMVDLPFLHLDLRKLEADGKSFKQFFPNCGEKW